MTNRASQRNLTQEQIRSEWAINEKKFSLVTAFQETIDNMDNEIIENRIKRTLGKLDNFL